MSFMAGTAMFGASFLKFPGKSAGVALALTESMDWTHAVVNALTEKVIGAAIEVHRTLGPGLLERVYRECLVIELTAARLCFQSERRIPLEYKGHRLRSELQLDLLVEDCLVVELKAVEAVIPVHLAQVITYLKLTGYPAGLLMNFNTTSLRSGLRRLDHPELHRKHRTIP